MPRAFLADTLWESRSALRLVLVDVGMQVVGEAPDWENTMELAPKAQPDILVVDWSLLSESAYLN